MYQVTPARVLVVLAFYGALLVVIRLVKPQIEPFERRTFVVVGLCWAVPVFIANYLLHQAGAMSFLPWMTNWVVVGRRAVPGDHVVRAAARGAADPATRRGLSRTRHLVTPSSPVWSEQEPSTLRDRIRTHPPMRA